MAANKITTRDMELLVGALKHSNNFKLDTDYTAFNKEFGFNSESTARTRVGQVVRKLREAALETPSTVEPRTPKKPKAAKVVKTPGSGSGKKGKKLVEEDDDEEMPVDDDEILDEKKDSKIKIEDMEEEDEDEQYA